jgi:pimeloyl-ACP methyl ester carboxylesterase
VAERAEIDETPGVSTPETRYAKSDGVNVAYQVVGDGPFDLVLAPGSLSHVEVGWRVPTFARLLKGLAEFSRLIVFDKRGTGMSDRLDESMTFEQRMDDIRAVMDATGSERAALMGISEGAPMSILFAATYPERATALVLYGGFAKETWAHGYPLGTPVEEYEREATEAEANWGAPGWLEALASGALVEADQDEACALADVFRYSASPGAAAELTRSGMGATSPSTSRAPG